MKVASNRWTGTLALAMYAGLGLLPALTACNGNGEAAQPMTLAPGSETTPSRENLPDGPGPVATSPPEPEPTPTSTQDPSQLYTGPAGVAKYVEKFVADALARNVDVLPDMRAPKLSIRIASLDSYGTSVIGLCESTGSLRRVTFDPDFWNSVSETQRELLAHHEFGHCVLSRGHRSAVLSSGIYASIMYPIIMGSSSYLSHYEYYQEELFSQAALSPLDAGLPRTHVCGADDLPN